MAGNRPNGLRVVQRKEPKGANMKIIDRKLTLRCEDGTELKADITDAKIAAIMLSKWMRGSAA